MRRSRLEWRRAQQGHDGAKARASAKCWSRFSPWRPSIDLVARAVSPERTTYSAASPPRRSPRHQSHQSTAVTSWYARKSVARPHRAIDRPPVAGITGVLTVIALALLMATASAQEWRRGEYEYFKEPHRFGPLCEY